MLSTRAKLLELNWTEQSHQNHNWRRVRQWSQSSRRSMSCCRYTV